jgi:uncharacterized membrane protein YukC
MKVTGTANIDVVLSETQVRHVTLEYICEKFDWYVDRYINPEDDWVYDKQPQYGHKVTYEHVRVREATETDYIVAQIVKSICQLKIEN